MRCENEIQEMLRETPTIEAGRAGMDSPKPFTVLLVEDEGFVREVTCKVLQSEGYRVLETRNAAEAKRKFRRHGDEIELLLTDVVLPDRNGLALATDLRAICPALKAIFMSGYPENAVTQSGLQEQDGLYLHKPFSTELLLEKIGRILQRDDNKSANQSENQEEKKVRS